jgi:hypothetical protein
MKKDVQREREKEREKEKKKRVKERERHVRGKLNKMAKVHEDAIKEVCV